jgi:hypothetical protein
MIKIKLPAELNCWESVWVQEITDNTGEIRNLPAFTEDYKYKDIIEFDAEAREAIGMIEDGGYTKTRLIRYKCDFRSAKTKWEAQGYVVEGFALGILGISRKRTKRKRTKNEPEK